MRFEHWLYTVPLRLRSLFRRGRVEDELDEEVQYHLEQQIQEGISKGLTPQESRYAALRAMGGVEQRKEECRDMRRVRVIEDLVQDLRYGLRTLRRTPGLTAVAVLSLALGIGANTAIFSLIDQLLLRALPVRHPEQLVKLIVTGPREFVGPQGRRESFGYRDFEHFRQASESLSGLLFTPTMHFNRNIAIGGVSEDARAILVPGTYFPTLGLNPTSGRLITPENETSAVAVISHGFWKRRFGLDTSIFDKTITFNQATLTIIGVAPREFFGLEVGFAPDIFVPARMLPSIQPDSDLLKSGGWLQVIGRIKTGVSPQQAAAELNALFRPRLQERLASAPPGTSEEDKQKFLSQRIELEPAGSGVSELRRRFSEPLLILMCVVMFVLVIACANIANLLLARAMARQREMSVRLALGASRQRLLRQLLTESTLLAGLGGITGLVFAYWIAALVVGFISKTFGSVNLTTSPDMRILAFTAAVSFVTGVLFGLVPAFRATEIVWRGSQPQAGFDSRPRARLGKGLVVLQVGVSLMLIVGSTLFVRTLRNLETFDAGFTRDRILLFSLNPPRVAYKELRLANLYAEILAGLKGIPGVRAVSLSALTPIDGSSITGRIKVDGFTPRSLEDQIINRNSISPGYFVTLGIPLLLGRDFSQHDTETAPGVVIVNDALARFYFPNQNPIGKQIQLPEHPRETPFEIVGVAGDTRYNNLRGSIPRLAYLPYTGYVKNLGAMKFELRTEGNPASFVAAVSERIQVADKSLKPTNVRTLATQIDESLTQERLVATVSSGFGLLAVLLASIGVYGVMSYSVTRRTAEIGIRIALGAERRDILWMISREVLVQCILGIVIGVPAALAAADLVTNLLFGVEPNDPLVLATAACVMTGVALMAGFLPARRASKVDPMVALRYE